MERRCSWTGARSRQAFDWERALHDALTAADALCVLWSRDAQKSIWVEREYRWFLAEFADRPCIPLRLDRTPLPPDLARRQAPSEFFALANGILDSVRQLDEIGVSSRRRAGLLSERLAVAGIDLTDPRVRKAIVAFGGTASLLALLYRGIQTVMGRLVMAALTIASIAVTASHCGAQTPTRVAIPLRDGGAVSRTADGDGNDAAGERFISDASNAATVEESARPLARGLEIVSPEFMLPPGLDGSFCFYTRTPNEETLAIRRWTSHLAGGIRNIYVFLDDHKRTNPDFVARQPCYRLVSPNRHGQLVYIAYSADAHFSMPVDDGEGRPIAQVVMPHQSVEIEMRVVNVTAVPQLARLRLSAAAYDSDIVVTRMSSLIAINGSIGNLPERWTSTDTCTLPNDAKLSTYMGSLAFGARVMDAGNVVFSTASLNDPSERWFARTPYYKFSKGRLEYQCDFGSLAARETPRYDDHVCVAIGYYFPAMGPITCPD